jgi:hypothetical protein
VRLNPFRPLLALAVAGFLPGSVLASPVTQSTATVTIGAACTKGKGVDAEGRPAGCTKSSIGRIWTWSSPIPSPVTDPALPGSWSGVTTDSTGFNGAGVGLTPSYIDRFVLEAEFVEEVNSWRAAKGLAPLTIDPRLTQLAKYWAERFPAPGGGVHCPKTLCSVRAFELGYQSFGEVMRPSTPIPAGSVQAEQYFLNSPSHFKILTGRYSHVGFAFHVMAGADGRPARMVIVGQVARSR